MEEGREGGRERKGGTKGEREGGRTSVGGRRKMKTRNREREGEREGEGRGEWLPTVYFWGKFPGTPPLLQALDVLSIFIVRSLGNLVYNNYVHEGSSMDRI